MLTNFQNSFTDRLSGKFAIKSLRNIPPNHRCVSTLPCEIFLFRNCLFLLKNVIKARETISLLERETPAFISPDLGPPNSPDLNPVDYKIWCIMQQRVYQTKVQDVNDLKRRLINVWADTWQLTSGGSVCSPVFEPEEDILSMHCDSRTI